MAYNKNSYADNTVTKAKLENLENGLEATAAAVDELQQSGGGTIQPGSITEAMLDEELRGKIGALGLTVGTDGKIYVTVDGAITGAGVEITGGTPVAPEDEIVVYDAKFEDIPQYFQDDVTAAVSYIDGLSGYTSYAAITDTHYPTNAGTAPSIVNYLLKAGKVHKILHIGDLVESGTVDDDKYQAAVTAKALVNNGNVLLVTGNHDYGLDKGIVFNAAMSKSRATFNPANGAFDWYWDDPFARIRLIGLDYRGGSVDSAWLSTTISAIPDGYAFAVMMHYTLQDANAAWTMCWGDNNAAKIKAVVADATAPFVGYITGHQHIDETVQLENGAYHTTLLCDRLENSPYYSYYEYPAKTKGANTEAAVTIISINPATRSVKFYRIGAANDAHRQWEYTYPETLTKPIPKPEEPTGKTYDLLTGLTNDVYLANGENRKYTGWSATDYLDCEGIATLEITNTSGQAKSFNYQAFYDSDKQFVSLFPKTIAASGTTTVEVPNGVKYFRLSAETEYLEGGKFTAVGKYASQEGAE